MIFAGPNHIDLILSGQKTQTRRLVNPDETWDGDSGPQGHIDIMTVYAGGRVKWEVDRTYAVVPKRGMPGVWWSNLYIGSEHHPLVIEKPSAATQAYRIETGWQPLRIRITAIRREQLQDISEADARAEGVGSIEAYAALWDSINGKTKGVRWADNPSIWSLTFEVVK